MYYGNSRKEAIGGVSQKKLAEILGVPYTIFLQPPDCQEKQDPHGPFYFRQASVYCNVAIKVRNFGKI